MAKRLTPARIAQLGREYKENQTELKECEKVKETITKEVIGDYQAKGIRTMEANGVKVTRSAQTRHTINWNYLAQHLSVRTMRSIQLEQVDETKLAEAVAAGKIDPALVAKATEFYETRAYLTVSIKES